MVRINSLAKHVLSGDIQYLLWKVSPDLLKSFYKISGKSDAEAYASMQKVIYEARSRIDSKQFVVGNFEANENYDWETPLLKPLKAKTEGIIALDFGCGPGRMIKRMSKVVERCDGIDISAENIRQAAIYCKDVKKRPNLYVNNGQDFTQIEDNIYDLVYSTIAMQHIPIHSIRQKLFTEMFRVLKPGGRISIQMAYGYDFEQVIERAKSNFPLAKFARWKENAYLASDTNGSYDCVITQNDIKHDYVKSDLEEIGFTEISFEFTDVTRPKHYDNWIFIYGQKPEYNSLSIAVRNDS